MKESKHPFHHNILPEADIDEALFGSRSNATATRSRHHDHHRSSTPVEADFDEASLEDEAEVDFSRRRSSSYSSTPSSSTPSSSNEADLDEAEALGKGLDFSTVASSSAIATLKKDGYTFVGRYMSGGLSKDVKSTEAQALIKQGIQILIAAEGTGQEVKQGRNGGIAQAKRVLAQANEMKVPTNVVFYFAVDFDMTSSQETLLTEYLQGAASVVGINRVGLYGGYTAASYAVAHNLVAKIGSCHAVWQTYAWSAGKWASGITVRQTKNDVTVAGLDADLDTAMCPNIGAWA